MKLNDLITRSTRSSRELFTSILTSLIKGFFPRDVIRYIWYHKIFLSFWDIVKMDRADTSGFVSGGCFMLKFRFLVW